MEGLLERSIGRWQPQAPQLAVTIDELAQNAPKLLE